MYSYRRSSVMIDDREDNKEGLHDQKTDEKTIKDGPKFDATCKS